MDAVDAKGAARMIGRSRSWFYLHRKELKKAGFPEALPVSEKFDPTAIEAWKARQGRMGQAVPEAREEEARNRAFGL
jgi:predicted DNA-binding transcriptional regulator AlpA